MDKLYINNTNKYSYRNRPTYILLRKIKKLSIVESIKSIE